MNVKLRRMVAGFALALALALTVWLTLGLFRVVPLTLELPGESKVRTYAGAAVALLMLAAWGYWED